MVTSTNRPTDNRANIEQSAFSKVRQKKKGRDLQKETGGQPILLLENATEKDQVRPGKD